MKKCIVSLLAVSILLTFSGCEEPVDQSVQSVIDKIENIGEVTTEKDDMIHSIQQDYDILLPEQKQQVSNSNKLYDALVKLTIKEIDEIGNVDSDSQEDIWKAQSSYECLYSDLQEKVTNYQTLVDAQEEYDKILEEAEENYSGDDDYTTESSSDYTSSHTCSASGCYKAGTHEWTGIAGQEEWYCTDHYNKMMDLFAGMYADTYGY